MLKSNTIKKTRKLVSAVILLSGEAFFELGTPFIIK